MNEGEAMTAAMPGVLEGLAPEGALGYWAPAQLPLAVQRPVDGCALAALPEVRRSGREEQ